MAGCRAKYEFKTECVSQWKIHSYVKQQFSVGRAGRGQASDLYDPCMQSRVGIDIYAGEPPYGPVAELLLSRSHRLARYRAKCESGCSRRIGNRARLCQAPGGHATPNRVECLMSSTHPFLNERLAEAARYALMRRLLPAIRHDLAGSIQPIGMMAAMLEKRTKAATPDLVQLGKNSQMLNVLSREAAALSVNLMSWLAPTDNNLVAVSHAVQESLNLISTELSFRGFAIANETADLEMELPRGMLRSVFTASLIALTDGWDGVARVIVTAGNAADVAYLEISLEEGGSADLAMHGSLRTQPYRSLGWDDVLALASAEGVSLRHDDRGATLGYSVQALHG